MMPQVVSKHLYSVICVPCKCTVKSIKMLYIALLVVISIYRLTFPKSVSIAMYLRM